MDKFIILNPDYHFKNDIDRIVLYSSKKVQNYSSSDWISYIHPVQAFILDVFSKEDSLSRQYEKISSYINLPITAIESLVRPFIENETPVYTEFKGQKILFPKNVLVAKNKIDFNKNVHRIPCNFNCESVNLVPDRIHKAPQTLLFMLTNKCITNCKYCYADRKTKYFPLKTDKILNIIEESAKLGMTYIDVIGGEIFCRQDWNVILKKMMDLDLSPNYISTKVPILEKDIKLLRDTGYNNVVQISLDSLNEQILKDTIGCNLDYVKRMKHTIDLLCQYGFMVQIDTILTRQNTSETFIKELFNYIKIIPNLIYWEIRVPEVSIYTPIQFKEIQASKKQINDIGEYIKSVIIPQAKFKIYYSDEAIREEFYNGKITDECFKGGMCGILQNRLFVLPDGKVSVCEQLYWDPQFIIGDLTQQPISEVWNSSKALKLFNMKKNMFRSKSICFNCKSLKSCNMKHRRCFVKIIKAYGIENWDYPDPRCIYAPEIHSDLLYR